MIRDSNDPNACTYDYDLKQHSVILTDWDSHMDEDNAPGTRTIPQLPSSLLINGYGNFHDLKTDKYKFAPMAVFYVERGKKHRFRMMNTASHICPFSVSVRPLAE